MERTAEAIKRLQSCINDLISVLALPAIWSDHKPSQIVSTLLDVLLGMLRLDFAYVRLSDSVDSSPIEMVRLAQRRNPAAQPEEVGRALNRWLTGDPPISPLVVPNPVGAGEVSVAPLQLGLQDEIGILVVGSQRPDFPTEMEKLLLRVAANQAAIGLQEARRVSEQRRAAEELEQWVAERTRQLTAINEELRKEIIERKRSGQRLATQYAITHVLAQSDTLADAISHLLQTIGESMAWEWGALWNVDRDAGVLRCESIWHAPNLQIAEFDAISRETVGTPGRGLKGHVWQHAEPFWVADATNVPSFARAPIAARAGLHGAIGIPILLRGETVGVIEFFSCAIPQPDEEVLAMLSAIGNQIGQFVERKRVEEEQRKLASLVENSTDFIGIASPEGQVLFVNPAGQQMVGLAGDAHVRRTKLLDYVMDQDRERVEQQVLPAVMRDGRWEGETQFKHFKTGAAISMLHHVFLIKEPKSDRRLALATISRDITESRQTEEALHKAQAELAHVTRVMTMGELTASIAHEVNQPLAAVVTNGNACLRWLAREEPDLDEARAAVERMIRDGHRASDVIRRIRALSKNTEPQKARLDINDVIHEAVAVVHGGVREHRISLRTELSSALLPVLGDRIQLQQVILNLMINGIEAMDPITDRPRELLIKSQMHASDTVLVAVRDSGIGLDPQTLDRLFDAFFTTKPEGMGLGLSICRTIIEAHGGRLWATPNDGHGATVLFTLPPGRASVP